MAARDGVWPEGTIDSRSAGKLRREQLSSNDNTENRTCPLRFDHSLLSTGVEEFEGETERSGVPGGYNPAEAADSERENLSKNFTQLFQG